MKTFKNALRVSVLLTLVALVSCGKNSGGVGGVDPVTPNPVAPALTVVSSKTIVLDGSGPAGGSINIGVKGSPIPTVTADGVPVSNNYTIPSNLTESKDVVFRATNSAGSDEQTTHLNVVIDPALAKITGVAPSWKKWRMVSWKVDGVENIDACQQTWIYQWFANCKSNIDGGTCGGGSSHPSVFTFNKTNMTIVDGLPSFVETRNVTFLANGDMVFDHWQIFSDGLSHHVENTFRPL